MLSRIVEWFAKGIDSDDGLTFGLTVALVFVVGVSGVVGTAGLAVVAFEWHPFAGVAYIGGVVWLLVRLNNARRREVS